MVLYRKTRLQNAVDGRSPVVVADTALCWAAVILVVIAALSPF
jgi:hypothetical protein